jgi:hypothetical protein
MAKGSGIFVNTGKSMRIKEKHYPLQFKELDPRTGCWNGIMGFACFAVSATEGIQQFKSNFYI